MNAKTKPNPFLPNNEAEKYIPFVEYEIDEMIEFKNEIISSKELCFSDKFDLLIFNTIIFFAPVDEIAKCCGFDLIEIRDKCDLENLSKSLEFIIVYAEYEGENDPERSTQLEEKLVELGKKYNKKVDLEKLRKFKEEELEYHNRFSKTALDFMREVIKSI